MDPESENIALLSKNTHANVEDIDYKIPHKSSMIKWIMNIFVIIAMLFSLFDVYMAQVRLTLFATFQLNYASNFYAVIVVFIIFCLLTCCIGCLPGGIGYIFGLEPGECRNLLISLISFAILGPILYCLSPSLMPISYTLFIIIQIHKRKYNA